MKGFGILCVVIGHFIEYHRGTAPGINALFTCIYLFHMALFCICSGLVAHFSLWKLITQQVWLYAVGQALMLVFRAVLPVDPASQMITFDFANGACLTLRTSGTEPKIKYYMEVMGEQKEECESGCSGSE